MEKKTLKTKEYKKNWHTYWQHTNMQEKYLAIDNLVYINFRYGLIISQNIFNHTKHNS